MYPFADIPLARRLETVEAASSVKFVEARVRLKPDSAACWTCAGGASAIFDGPESPLTQTFGLGLFEDTSSSDLDTIERFFAERGALTFHEVSPLADAGTVALLTGRGYQPFEFTSVLYRPIDAALRLAGTPTELAVRRIEVGEEALWAATAAAGWREFGGLSDFMSEVGLVNAAAGAHLFLVESNGRPIATGALSIANGVAHLAGASTIPEGRNRGAQLALLEHRLRHAAAAGCDLASIGALPGSGSQRNAERHGFRIAYTRVKWRQNPVSPGSSQQL
jgi:hypothetical protein